MATRFETPLYSTLAIYLGGKRVRAHGGFFDIEDAATAKALRSFAKSHAHYRIKEVGEAPEPKTTGHGPIVQATGITQAERHPEIVAKAPTDDDSEAVDAAIAGFDDEVDAGEDDLGSEDS